MTFALKVKCECGRLAVLVDRGTHKQWVCDPCQAWVGCVSTSPVYEPLGRLADSELRYWKRRATEAFNALWQGAVQVEVDKGNYNSGVRARAYKWLAEQMHITPADCHFPKFTVAQCKRAYEICEQAAPAFLRG